MCLAIPGKIEKIEGSKAFFKYDHKKYEVDILLAPEVEIGDWILMHDGRALSKITEEEAKENLEFIKQHKEMACLPH
ncbi:MAG: HypC/HybG/HupF family hydrogenase formation chaperone [Patescibacteria group bacterium]